MADKRLCFVIAPIGDPESETRKRSDQILKYVIAPAVETLGYEAVRADQISEPGIITSQVIQHVVDDPLVVADLTDRNPNVFYELAIRHAIKKPLIQIIRRGEPLPFDVAGTRTISIDHRDLESVERAKQEIENQVRAIERSSLEIDSPISVALELQVLKQSDNPEKRSLADMLATLNEIRSSLSAIEKRLDNESSMNREFSSRLADYVLHDPNFFRLVWSKTGEGTQPQLSLEQLEALSDYVSALKMQNQQSTVSKKYFEKQLNARTSKSGDADKSKL